MINLSKKLYISIFSVLLLLVVAGTATYAWFELNTNAWFDDMELQVTSGKGVYISVNGVTWRNNLPESDIKKAVVAKSKGYRLNSNLDYLSSDGQIISSSNYERDYNDIVLGDVTSLDGRNFKSKDGDILTVSDLYYVSMDLFFKAEDNVDNIVYFSGYERKLPTGTIIPKTNIYTENASNIGFPTHLNNRFTTYTKIGNSVEYDNAYPYIEQAEEIKNFKSYVSDAFRFSVYSTVNNIEGETKIYELSLGNGSYATDFDETYYEVGHNTIGPRYDADKNAGFTYFNNVRGYYGSTTDLADPILYENRPKTYKSFNQYEAAKLLELNASNNYGNGGTAKITLNMWIEGLDADCFDSIYDQRLICDFAFTTAEPQNGTVEVTVIDGEQTDTYKVQSGYQIDVIDPIKNSNNKFKYWALDTDLTKPYDFSQQVWKNITLKAVRT